MLKKYPAKLTLTSFTCFFGLIQFLVIAVFVETEFENWKIQSIEELFTILYAVIFLAFVRWLHMQNIGSTWISLEPQFMTICLVFGNRGLLLLSKHGVSSIVACVCCCLPALADHLSCCHGNSCSWWSVILWRVRQKSQSNQISQATQHV